MNRRGEKPSRVGLSVTWHFGEEDALAISYELSGTPERRASRSDLRSFVKRAIRNAIAEAHRHYDERPEERDPTPKKGEAKMTLLRPAEPQTAYLKMGNYGGAGSGKTWTSSLVAIGLAKKIGDGKPVAFFDTETGSDYVLPLFRAAGVELLVVKSRAFADLLEFVPEAERLCSVAIVDSITHVWDELKDAYERKLGRKTGLEIWDWAPIKREWRQFTDAYLNCRLHMIICGRAGNVYEQQWNEEKGKREVIAVDTKMRAETEMSYEP